MKKGSKMTEEQRRRLSEVHKNYKPSKETKIKISKSMKGKTPMNIKLLISKARTFQKGQTPWNKDMKVDKIKFPNMGHFKKNSEETKKKISEATKRAMANPEIRKKISERLKGKLSAMRGKKTGKPSWIKGKHHTEEAKMKMREAVGKRLSDPDFLKKLKEIHRKRLSDPEEMKRQVEVSRRTLLKLYESGVFPKQENTKPEKEVKAELIKGSYKEGADFIHQYKFMNKFMCDFCFPNQKIIVEVYGDFWHVNPNKYPEGRKLHPHQIKGKGRDKSKEAYITKIDNGSWTYLVLWESDIKKDVAKCVDTIEEVLTKKR